MLHQINDEFHLSPEALRAVLLASSITNIDGPQGIPRIDDVPVDDLRDGAGEVRADLAAKIAETYYPANDDTHCQTACWSYQTINISATSSITEPVLVRNFSANRGDRIRAAISWWSNPDGPTDRYNFDGLDTRFDLRVEYQRDNNEWIVPRFGSSESEDNNYELIDTVLPITGNYRLVVPQPIANRDEELNTTIEVSNTLGVAILLIDNVYLPVIDIE